MYKYLLITIASLSFAFLAHAQKEANVWYFGDQAGLDFNSGEPQKIIGPLYSLRNCASISDGDGSFLFSTNGEKIWNAEGEIMENGDDLKGSHSTTSGVLIVEKPGNGKIYYVFTAARHQSAPGMYYSVVDMEFAGGLGKVTSEKNIPLVTAWDAMEKLTAVKHENNNDIWVITRKDIEDSYASFLLTSNGIELTPVISFIPEQPYEPIGSMKISYDKMYFISANAGNGIPSHEPHDRFQINRFNPATGKIEFMYSVRLAMYDPDDGPSNQGPNSVEFSPDSKLVYFASWAVSTENQEDESEHRVYQYDMTFIEDSALFVESAILISHNGGSGIQLATDGKIYCGLDKYNNAEPSPVHVIHYPGKRGAACSFEENTIEFPDGYGAKFYFPNIMTDYLYRFEFEGHCSEDPFFFQSNFQPQPAFIEWDFGDPLSGSNNISNDINPVHTFSYGAQYEVNVYVEYPSGRIEETSRVVSVTATPTPILGPDRLKCLEDEITLFAGNAPGFYVWSNGSFGENANEIIVSDTGTFWVQVTNDGCVGTDTVHIGLFPKPQIDESELEVLPTNCGGSNGKILGLMVTGQEPLTFEWYDADNNFLSSNIDLTGLAVGNYFLHILDGHGCTTISNAYTIDDAGGIDIYTIVQENDHCGQSLAKIGIGAGSPATDHLLYSIDNGSSWQTADSLFTGLSSGTYNIRVRDTLGCESAWENNPLVIEDIPGPQVSGATTTNETDYQSDGQIDITANLASGDIFYSIDNGAGFQTNNGLFTSLPAGLYPCVVKDGFGCDTSFTVEVGRDLTQVVGAIAGNGTTCIGDAAVVPLKLDNFTDILKFNVKLTYDTAMLSCDGYINIHPLLEDKLLASIVPGTNEVNISWQGELPTTLEENAIMLELVFGAKEEGASGIDWAALPGESAFYNSDLEQINAEYHFGVLRVYTRPKIIMGNEREVCEGESISITPFIQGGSGEVNYLWQGPNGFESTGSFIEFQNTKQQDAGNYLLTVTDTIDCTESIELLLTVKENPQIAFGGVDTITTQAGFILEAGSGYESYLWNTGDTTDAITVNTEGLYNVFVTSGESCVSTDSVTVLWESIDITGGFYLPNAFTPNGDGLNDEFKPVQKYDHVSTYHLSIYNRWGEMIFETNDIEQGWDGTFKGKPAQQGSYVYRIIYTAWSTGNETQVAEGVVVVVR